MAVVVGLGCSVACAQGVGKGLVQASLMDVNASGVPVVVAILDSNAEGAGTGVKSMDVVVSGLAWEGSE